MLQRVQTIYLLISAGLLFGFLNFPIAELVNIKFQIIEFNLISPALIKDQTLINTGLVICNILIWILTALIILTILLSGFWPIRGLRI